MIEIIRNFVLGHWDLDGIAGVTGVLAAHPGEHNVVKFATYADVDELTLAALTETRNPFKRVILVDICFDPGDKDPYTIEDIAQRQRVQALPGAVYEFWKRGGELVILDHHGKRVELAKSRYARYLSLESIMESKDPAGIPRAGSELAGRYLMGKILQNPNPLSELGRARLMAMVKWLEVCGVYDTWRKDDPLFRMGSLLAMAQSLMLDDPYGCLRDMQATVDEAANRLVLMTGTAAEKVEAMDERFWLLSLEGNFADYAINASDLFEAEVKRCRETGIQHHPRVLEIHCDFFESLVADRLGAEMPNGGVVVIRYKAERHLAGKLSLRCVVPGVHLGDVAGDFGGGGHPGAAGIVMRGNTTIDAVVDRVIEAVEGRRPEKVKVAA